jgi:hypothetical protein
MPGKILGETKGRRTMGKKIGKTKHNL